MSAELCPVCNGSGVVPDPAYGHQTTTSALPITKTCHGCDGKGWVEVCLEDSYPWNEFEVP